MKFQLHLKPKMLKNKDLSEFVFIMLIYVKMSTIVGILTLMSIINLVLGLIEHEKSFITSGLVLQTRVNFFEKNLDQY